jgi:hypothetical protein
MALPNVPFSGTGIDYGSSSIPITKKYLHELGADLSGEPIEDQFVVPPRGYPVQIKIRSEVVVSGANQLRSVPFMASMRRRHADAVAKMVVHLEEHADGADFSVYTFPVFAKVKELIEMLQPAEKEGNSRLILRMVRDSLMNGRWERYRIAGVREKVASLVEKRLVVEEVTMADADAAFDELLELGLDPVGTEIPMMDQVDEQEEAQVPG